MIHVCHVSCCVQSIMFLAFGWFCRHTTSGQSCGRWAAAQQCECLVKTYKQCAYVRHKTLHLYSPCALQLLSCMRSAFTAYCRSEGVSELEFTANKGRSWALAPEFAMLWHTHGVAWPLSCMISTRQFLTRKLLAYPYPYPYP